MKKVIKGKVYDTEKSTLVTDAYYNDGYGRLGNYYIAGASREYLYVTNNGNYFICQNDEEIYPVGRYGALEWLEENGETDIIEEYFSDMVEEA